MRAATWPPTIREASKLWLVHGIQDRYGRPLDNLVLKCRHADRALLAIPLWDVHPPHRLRTVGAVPQSIRQLGEVRLQILAVVFPPLAVHAWCRITFQVIE